MSVAASTVRDRVQTIGREIFDRARHAEPSVFETAWWDQQVLDWAMRHERLKVQLFRFIDVLPALTAPEQVAEHLAGILRARRCGPADKRAARGELPLAQVAAGAAGGDGGAEECAAHGAAVHRGANGQ